MIPTTNSLLICALFLCGLQETVLSQRGHCTENRCVVLNQKLQNFTDARKSCQERDGQLLVFDPEHVTKLLSGLNGNYWLDGTGTKTQEAAAGLQNCSSVSMSMEQDIAVLSEPCESLKGFLCQYTFQEPCSGLQAGGGAQVKYTIYMSFETNDSETLPPGTIAAAEKVGGKYPESKHVCYASVWMPAPWTCEVLQGGCEHGCTGKTCTCPAGQYLHPNGISCATEPCVDCAHECQQESDKYVCKCRKGYRLAQDGTSCVGVNVCKEDNPCTGENEECVNTRGKFECRCKEGFVKEDEACVDVRICDKCEHMRCEKFSGVYECVCRKGFRVSEKDPTKCELNCTERDCPAQCVPNPEKDKKGMFQCYCPEGYIQDSKNNIPFCTDINECANERHCDHTCVNFFGGYRCLCDEGFKLQGEFKCVPTEEEDGSGSTPPYPTAASSHPATVPPYIKAGSILGMSVFVAVCLALLYFPVRNATKRCGRFNLSSIKHTDIDIFYLQQVTTDTYKKLSFDKQFKNDVQKL